MPSENLSIPSRRREGIEVHGDSSPSRPGKNVLPCHDNDPDLWFAETPGELEYAKTLCAGCPVRARCLAAALEREEPWGVWGGEIIDRGVVVARKRPRGRPRKHPVVEPRKELVCV